MNSSRRKHRSTQRSLLGTLALASLAAPLLLALQAHADTTLAWRTINGAAKDIGVAGVPGADAIHVVGTDDKTYTFSGAWAMTRESAAAIDVGPNGVPWIVKSDGSIFRRVGTTWVHISGCAKDVGVGGDGTVWVVGCNAFGNDFMLYKREGESWTPVNHGGLRLDVDKNGNPWVVHNSGQISRLTSRGWETVQGCARDIGIGQDARDGTGTVYVIGCPDVDHNGGGIYRYNGGGVWTLLPGVAHRITADGLGRPWVAQKSQGGIAVGDIVAGAPPAPSPPPPTEHAVDSPSMQGGVSVPCTYAKLTSAENSHRLNCGEHVKLHDLSATVASRRNYTFTGQATTAVAFPSLTGVVDLLGSQLLTGLNQTAVVVRGPDNGNDITLRARVGLGAAFDDLNEAIVGMSGLSLKSVPLDISVTLTNGVARFSATLYEGSRDHTVPETGTSFRLKKVWLTYDSGTKEKAVHATADIKLSSNDSWAGLEVKYGKIGAGTLTPSGTITNLNKPFGVMPIAVNRATFSGTLTDKVGGEGGQHKRYWSAMSLQVTEGVLYDLAGGSHTLTGGFSYDTVRKTFAVNAGYSLCGDPQRLVVDSKAPADSAQSMLSSLENLAKSVSKCVSGATCAPGYTKVGLQCDKTCPGGGTNAPGFCNYPCAGFGLDGAPPSCMKRQGMTSCPAPTTQNALGLCVFECSKVGLPGAPPSCMNPDNAKPLIWPR